MKLHISDQTVEVEAGAALVRFDIVQNAPEAAQALSDATAQVEQALAAEVPVEVVEPAQPVA